jgi:hypothetical protein
LILLLDAPTPPKKDSLAMDAHPSLYPRHAKNKYSQMNYRFTLSG